MIRIVKALGLTLVAVYALGAVMASGATAAEFTSFNTNTLLHEGGTVVGTDLEEMVVTVAGEAIQVKCSTNTYTGSSLTGTEPTPLVKPSYSGCNAFLFGGKVGSAEVKTTGCEVQFHVTGGSGDTWTGTMSIVCPAGVAGIDITTSGGCSIVLPAEKNTAVNGMTYTDVTVAAPTDVVVDVNATNLHSTTAGGPIPCGTSNGTHTAGTLKGKVTLRSFNSKTEQIDYTVR
jgi:hypothetical protein